MGFSRYLAEVPLASMEFLENKPPFVVIVGKIKRFISNVPKNTTFLLINHDKEISDQGKSRGSFFKEPH